MVSPPLLELAPYERKVQQKTAFTTYFAKAETNCAVKET